MTTYGYIGLGMMGAAMAERLLATGARTVVYDIDDAAVQTAVDKGATAAGSPAEVAAAVDVLSVCVPAAEHIDAVMTGAAGVGAGARPGLVVLVPVIAPYQTDRAAVRARHEEAGLDLVEVFVDTPLADCEARDPKGLYAKARAGEIEAMTGVDDPYEPPESPELVLTPAPLDEQAAAVLDLLGTA